MSKLSLIEWTIKQLDDLDKADDVTMAWAEREPYRRRLAWWLSESRRHLDNMRAAALLAGHGLLDRLAWVKPPKRKKSNRLNRAAEYCTDDARRIKALWEAKDCTPPKVNAVAAEVAVERHVRLTGMHLSEEERHNLVDKVTRRLEKPSGPSRVERKHRVRAS